MPRAAGLALRIAAQLNNVHDGYQIWADRYDRNIDDVFAIQDEIAHAITESLKVALARPFDEPIVRKATANLEAQQLQKKGGAVNLVAGMTAAAEIVTERKTLLQFALTPLLEPFQN